MGDNWFEFPRTGSNFLEGENERVYGISRENQRETKSWEREKLGNKTWENSSFLQTNRKVEMVYSIQYCIVR